MPTSSSSVVLMMSLLEQYLYSHTNSDLIEIYEGCLEDKDADGNTVANLLLNLILSEIKK